MVMRSTLTRRGFFGRLGSASAVMTKLGAAFPAAELAIVPRPRWLRRTDASYPALRPDTPVLLGKSLFAAEHRWSCLPLLRKLKGPTAPEPLLAPGGELPLPCPCILIGSPADHESLRKLAASLKPRLASRAASSLGEGYLLETGPFGVRIGADTAAGVFYAVQTLLQLPLRDTIPGCQIADAPDVPFRGSHVRAFDPNILPAVHRFIRETLPRYKANTLIVEVDYHFRYRSHPEINEATMLEESDARELARLSREHNLRLIPLLNCFSHQSWRDRIHGLLRAYPQFNETPCKTGVLFYAWCARDPRIAPTVCDLIDELLVAFESEAIHLGMDEVLEIGRCQFCRRKTPGELFAKVVNEFHAHVTGKRGARMLIWADRLIDGRKTPYNPMNGARNGTHTALPMIPKDILLCDWHYHLHDAYPSVEMFRDAGLDFVACGWRNKDAIRAFQSYARKHGGQRYKGYLTTNWSPFQPIAEYLTGASTEATPEVRNFAECIQLGLESAWTGV